MKRLFARFEREVGESVHRPDAIATANRVNLTIGIGHQLLLAACRRDASRVTDTGHDHDYIPDPYGIERLDDSADGVTRDVWVDVGWVTDSYEAACFRPETVAAAEAWCRMRHVTKAEGRPVAFVTFAVRDAPTGVHRGHNRSGLTEIGWALLTRNDEFAAERRLAREKTNERKRQKAGQHLPRSERSGSNQRPSRRVAHGRAA